jgi:hypothetical protein
MRYQFARSFADPCRIAPVFMTTPSVSPRPPTTAHWKDLLVHHQGGYGLSLLGDAIPNCSSAPIKNASDLGFGCIFLRTAGAVAKLVYPERGTSDYLVRASFALE